MRERKLAGRWVGPALKTFPDEETRSSEGRSSALLLGA
jgi:hypothetical protein